MSCVGSRVTEWRRERGAQPGLVTQQASEEGPAASVSRNKRPELIPQRLVLRFEPRRGD
jgi:hypothetical protein